MLRAAVTGVESIDAAAGSELVAEWMDDVRRGVGKAAPASPAELADAPADASADEDDEGLTEEEIAGG